MNEYEELSLELLGEILGQLKQLNAAADARKPHVCYTKRIEDYPSFDWEAFGANVVEQDDDGVSLVEFKGEIYSRRSPSNKFAPAIWFSRSDGKDEDGTTRYVKLIIFKQFDFDAEPIPQKAKQLMQRPAPAPITTYAHPSELAPITQALTDAGLSKQERLAWLQEQGYSDPRQISAAAIRGLTTAAQAAVKAANDPAVVAAKALAGATGGEVVNAST